jgi:ABC-type bacteriocin/lantibiotic exporter with double-glycine peptidase domain
MPHKIPAMIWHGFIKDGIRIYKVMPRRLKFSFWCVFGLQLSVALTETFTLLVISLFAMSAANPEAARNHFMVKPFLEIVPAVAEFCSSPRRMVAFTSSFMIAFVLIKNILATITNHFTTVFSEKVAIYVGRESIKRYLNKGYYWHISPQSGEIIHKIMNRANLSSFTVMLLQLYSNVICCLFLFISLFIAQPGLTLVVIACFSVSSIILYVRIRHSLDHAGQLVSTTSIDESVTMTAMTKGIREIITYQQQDVALQKMMNAVEKGLPSRAYLVFCQFLPTVIMESVGFSTIGGMVIYLLASHVPMAEIVSAASILMLTAWRILPAVTRCLSYVVNMRGIKPRALLCLDLLENFTKEEVEPVTEPDPNFRFDSNITLKDACFHYPNSATDVLEQINMTIKKGQSIGLIGPSGAGKSTMALLLSGLVSPTSGSFTVDGLELEPASRAAYLSRLGYVPQNPLLMEGTLADNVAFSKWGQNYDRNKVLEACKLAAMEFVDSDPKALDKPLGSGGGLSGGQAQRVAIARAHFTSPEIIIFDEATSSLDRANENIIRSTITRIRGQITSIIIAHRLTTVEDCDLLFWIEKGRIRKSGPPSELIALYEAESALPPETPSVSTELDRSLS